MGGRLDDAERKANHVAPKHTFAHQEEGDVQEDAADAGIALSQRLQDANHVGAFENDDKQTGYHRETGYRHHQDEDDDDIDIQDVKPAEYHRVQLFDGADVQGVPVAVLNLGQIEVEVLGDGVQTVVVVHQQLQSADLVVVPSVEASHLADVGEEEQFVIVLEAGLVDAGDVESPGADLFLHEVGEERIA